MFAWIIQSIDGSGLGGIVSIRSETGRKVFITNMGYHDFSKAKRFGDIVPCTKGDVDLLHTDRIEARIQTVLDDSEDTDYLLISGHQLLVALCIGYWFRLHRTVNILYWDALVGDYLVRPADFSPKLAQIEMLLEEDETDQSKFTR